MAFLAGTLPEDAVAITDDDAALYMGNPPDGKTRIAENGMPAWGDAPPLSQDELRVQAETMKESLLKVATSKITVWQTKTLIGRALMDDEKAHLNSWIDYVDKLNAIDITLSPVSWPDSPDK